MLFKHFKESPELLLGNRVELEHLETNEDHLMLCQTLFPLQSKRSTTVSSW